MVPTNVFLYMRTNIIHTSCSHPIIFLHINNMNAFQWLGTFLLPLLGISRSSVYVDCGTILRYTVWLIAYEASRPWYASVCPSWRFKAMVLKNEKDWRVQIKIIARREWSMWRSGYIPTQLFTSIVLQVNNNNNNNNNNCWHIHTYYVALLHSIHLPSIDRPVLSLLQKGSWKEIPNVAVSLVLVSCKWSAHDGSSVLQVF